MNKTGNPLNGRTEEERATVRSKDLSKRERANFVISSEIMSQLREKSANEQIPMSRMIDKALQCYLGAEDTEKESVSLQAGITMSHLLELYLIVPYNQAMTERVFQMIKEHFAHFTYARCAFRTHLVPSVVMGTKFILFLKDEENESFSEFLNEMSSLIDEESGDVKLVLDGVPLSFSTLKFSV